MCDVCIRVIYALFLQSGGRASEFVEAHIEYTIDDGVSEDDFRNESAIYGEFFSLGGREYLLNLFQQSMIGMKGLGFHESLDILEGLAFIQQVGATALWKFNLNLGGQLEDFVRGFDRLDIFEEKERLYFFSQEFA